MGDGFHEYDVPTGEEVDQILANLKNGVKFGLDRAKVSDVVRLDTRIG